MCCSKFTFGGGGAGGDYLPPRNPFGKAHTSTVIVYIINTLGASKEDSEKRFVSMCVCGSLGFLLGQTWFKVFRTVEHVLGVQHESKQQEKLASGQTLVRGGLQGLNNPEFKRNLLTHII